MGAIIRGRPSALAPWNSVLAFNFAVCAFLLEIAMSLGTHLVQTAGTITAHGVPLYYYNYQGSTTRTTRTRFWWLGNRTRNNDQALAQRQGTPALLDGQASV